MRATRSAPRSPSMPLHQLLGPLEASNCAACALVALARILLAWSCSASSALFSAFIRSRLRRFSSVSRWVEVGLPAHVVDVHLRPGWRRGGSTSVDATPRAAPTSWEITTSPPLWLQAGSPAASPIESASRWLVGSSSSSVGAGEQDPGELNPPALVRPRASAGAGRAAAPRYERRRDLGGLCLGSELVGGVGNELALRLVGVLQRLQDAPGHEPSQAEGQERHPRKRDPGLDQQLFPCLGAPAVVLRA